MGDRRKRAPQLSEEQTVLWDRFVDAYSTTGTRPAVDMFLQALFGGGSDGGAP